MSPALAIYLILNASIMKGTWPFLSRERNFEGHTSYREEVRREDRDISIRPSEMNNASVSRGRKTRLISTHSVAGKPVRNDHVEYLQVQVAAGRRGTVQSDVRERIRSTTILLTRGGRGSRWWLVARRWPTCCTDKWLLKHKWKKYLKSLLKPGTVTISWFQIDRRSFSNKRIKFLNSLK